MDGLMRQAPFVRQRETDRPGLDLGTPGDRIRRSMVEAGSGLEPFYQEPAILWCACFTAGLTGLLTDCFESC
jgi:hypothetical protein